MGSVQVRHATERGYAWHARRTPSTGLARVRKQKLRTQTNCAVGKGPHGTEPKGKWLEPRVVKMIAGHAVQDVAVCTTRGVCCACGITSPRTDHPCPVVQRCCPASTCQRERPPPPRPPSQQPCARLRSSSACPVRTIVVSLHKTPLRNWPNHHRWSSTGARYS